MQLTTVDSINISDLNDYDDYIFPIIRNSSSVAQRTSVYVAVVHSIIGTVGIVGNLLVVIVILNLTAMKKWFANILIINQSAIDLVASAMMLMTAARAEVRVPDRKMGGFVDEIACRLWYNEGALWSSLIASSYNLVAIAFERYIAVVYPIVYRNLYTAQAARCVCLVPWAIGVLFVGISQGVYGGRCLRVGAVSSSTRLGKMFNGISALVLVFILPTTIYVFCYSSMYRSLRRAAGGQQPPQQATSEATRRRDRMSRIRHNVLATQVTVVATFIACWSLNQVLFAAFNFGYRVDFTGSLFYSSRVLVFANCCANPFIYAFKYQMFQSGLRKLFCRVAQTTDDELEAVDVVNTATTTAVGSSTAMAVRF